LLRSSLEALVLRTNKFKKDIFLENLKRKEKMLQLTIRRLSRILRCSAPNLFGPGDDKFIVIF
jgi:hypothetical protein